MNIEQIIEYIPKTITFKDKEYPLTMKYNKYAKYWDIYYGKPPFEFYECFNSDLKTGLNILYDNLIKSKIINKFMDDDCKTSYFVEK